ncbi:MAG: 2-dehydro-3-deoxy-D-gluconate 5-dehydrogenase KduD [Deinococcales bacterium]
MDLFLLHNKTALVTGAATGIGQAIALGLAAAGADVIIVSNSSSSSETLEGIAKSGRRSLEIKADLADPNSAAAVLEASQSFAAVDILVNNAGIIRRADALEYAYEDWALVVETNQNALWRLTQTFGREMLAQGSGKVINIASLLSFQGGIRVPAYTAAKHAVTGITKALANEWSGRGVQVNAIAPGYIATANTAALRADETRNRQILERIPAGRWGQPTDLVGAAVFLASSASDYVTGHVLVVDGGWMAR